MNRRTALRTLALGSTLPLVARSADAASVAPAGSPATPQFTLGVASISLKSRPLPEALAVVKQLGMEAISLHRAHTPWDSAPAVRQHALTALREAGVALRCCGVMYLPNEEKPARALLEYVRDLGVPLFSCSIAPEALPLLERLVQEFNLRAAIHNHGPEDKAWPGAAKVGAAVESLDPRIGLCLDVGHSFRAGENPAEMARRFRSRLFDVHIKDTVAAVGQPDVPVEMGRGRIDLAEVLTTLIATGYRENVWLEYEKDPNDPVAGLAESIGYLRGLLRGLKVT